MSDLHDVVRRLVDDARERLAADAVALWLRGADGSELVLSGAVGFRQPATSAELAHRPAARVSDWLIAQRLPAVCLVEDTDACGERAWLAAEQVRSLLVVPLVDSDTALGVLAAFRRRRPFPAGSLARGVGIAAAATPVLRTAERVDAQRSRAELAELLLEVARVLAAAPDLERAMDDVAGHTARALGAARGDVRLSASAATFPARGALVVPVTGDGAVVGRLALEGAPPDGWSPAAMDVAAAVGAEIGRAATAARARTIGPTPELIQREALGALADVVSGAAHHLNNLLTIVVGRVQLALRSTDDARVLRPLAIVDKAARDTAEVVRRLQEFALVRPVRRPRPVRVDQLLAEVVAQSAARWPRTPLTKIDVESRLDDVPAVPGDAAALREALGHIVANAMEAMPAGGRLTVETRASETSVRVVITDTGAGMPEAVRRRAPEPFFTTKGDKATGLGLSVAYGVARSHGGDLAIRSADGAGTTVTLTLPREGRAAGEG